MGNRGTRTVLFTDVVGSTRLRTTFGDDAVDTMMRVHDRIVHAAVASHDGEVVKGTGDGCLTVFSSARAAVSAAVDVQRSISATDGLEGPPLAVRIGVHSGEVRPIAGDVLGEAVNAAARIADRADGGEIVISRVVRDLMGTTGLVLTDRGEHELRGFPQLQQLFTVEWAQDAGSDQLEVRLLGHPALSVGGVAVDAFGSQRLQRLLALLTLDPGEAIPRTRIAFRLWPDSTETQARTNLRKLLHELRAAVPRLESSIEVDQHHLRWRADAAGWADVIAFREAIDRGDAAPAVECYGGDLLPDCYDDWVLEARDELRQAAGGALDLLTATAEEAGDLARVVESAHARLRLDPCWEPAYQHLMRAHRLLGNRAEALRIYHRCAEVLSRELGVEPDPLTRRVYDEIRRVDGADEVAPAPSVDGTPEVGDQRRLSATLIGRDDELAQLRATWDDARAGRSQLVLVTGEAGIGKSRLADELARSVAGSGTVVRSRAYEAAGRLPWGPAVEWLRADQVRAAVDRLAPAWRRELQVLLPELREEAPVASEADRPGPDQASRTQLFDAVAHALVAVDRPRLLLIDDLQWCDADTVDLIGYLISSRPTAPLLVAGTVRRDEVAEDHPLTRLAGGLGHEGRLTEIPLEPLDVRATADLAHGLTGESLPADGAERLWRDTAGNPLFLVEAVRAGLHAGPGAEPAPLSPTVKATIASRLNRLPPTARGVAELAATIGREFTAELLVAASDDDEADVLDSLDELWRRRLVGEHGVAYDFTHDKVREVAYDGVSPVRRRRLHRAVADALVASTGADPGPHSAQIAAHLEAAGRVSDAVDAHLRAAQHATTVFGLDEAMASCRRALALLDVLPPGPGRDERELEIRLTLGGPTVSREGYGSASSLEVYERTLTLCRHLGRQADAATLRGLGLASVTSCRFDRAQHFGEELLALSGDPIARTEGHYLLGVTAFWRGDLTASEHHLTAALAAYDPARGPTHRAYFAQDPKAVCTVRLGLTRLWQGDVEAARDLATEARTFAASLDHPMTLGYVLLYTAMIATELDDVALLRRDTDAEEGLGQHGLGFVRVIACLYTAWLAVIDDRPGALEQLDAAVAGCRVEHESLHLSHALSLLARAHLRLGSHTDGLRTVREGIAWGAARDQRYAEPLLRRLEGELLEAQGAVDAAADAYERAAEVAEALLAHRFHRPAVERLERVRARA